MADDSDTGLVRPGDILTAMALLTRLPGLQSADMTRGAGAAWAYPLVGALVGLVAGLSGLFALSLGLAPPFAAGIALAAGVAVTGALHEDGLADVADGFWGGWTTERRLEIMKDSRIGSYGVIALGLSLILRWAALSILFETENAVWVLIVAGAASRAGMVGVMATLPHARADGLARTTGRAAQETAMIAGLVALGLGLLGIGFAVIALACVIAGLALGMRALARAKIGGQTGDVLGATQQVTEIAALMWLASA